MFGPTAIVTLTRTISFQADLEDAARARNLAEGPQFRVGLAFSR